MTHAFGELGLGGAMLMASATAVGAAAAARTGRAAWLGAARAGLGGAALLLTIAAGALLVALLTSDFRFAYVAGYTERALPWGYKVAAFWAGQEGSLLLWGWLLAVMSVVAVAGLRRLRAVEQATVVGVLAIVVGFFAALMLFAADPFTTTTVVPADGRGLNPMLQDPGMIAHPPLLFIGYAGFTIPFAVLLAVLVSGRRDNRWLAEIRRWLLVSWLFLTAGIVLGAWWAYVELGWGGYWAWDPVENASILPWFTATALLHSIVVQQHRGMFKVWNASLLALSFILCIFGTWLTRSGVIDSVHAFAPSLIGAFFLAFMTLCVVVTAGLLIWRRRALRAEHEIEAFVSREGAFLLANVILVVMMLTTLVGTVFPLISGAVGEPITVKAPFYNRVVAPMGLLLVALMAVGPVLAFGRSAGARIVRSLVVPGAAALLATATVAAAVTTDPWALLCVAITTLGTFTVVVGFIRAAAARRKSTGEGPVRAAAHLVDRDHRRYGGQLAHLGVMMLVVGVVGSSLFDREDVLRLAPGASAPFGAYRLTLRSLDEVRSVNYTAIEATVEVREGGDSGDSGAGFVMRPQVRYYDAWGNEPNSEVAIRSTWREDLYVSLAGWEGGGRIVALQIRRNPLVLWIWVGGIVMGLGAIVCVLPPVLPRTRTAGAEVAVPRREPVRAHPARPRPVTARTATTSAIVLSAALLGLAAAAHAGPPAGGNKFPLPNEIPAAPVPAPAAGGAGRLAVRAVQGTPDAAPIVDALVTVQLVHRGAVVHVLEGTLDEHGVIVFEDVPVALGVTPVARVEHAGVTYQQPGTPMSAAQPQQTLEVTCFAVTEQMPAWAVPMRHVVVERVPGGVHVTELVVVENPAQRTWLGRAGATERPATAVFELPDGATQVTLGRGFHDWCCTTLDGRTLANHLPMMPERSEMQFGYVMPARDGRVELSLVAPASVQQMIVVVPSGLAAQTEGVEPGASEMRDGRAVDAYRAAGLEAGERARIVLTGFAGTGGTAAPGDTGRLKTVMAIVTGVLLLIAVIVLIVRPRQGGRGPGEAAA